MRTGKCNIFTQSLNVSNAVTTLSHASVSRDCPRTTAVLDSTARLAKTLDSSYLILARRGQQMIALSLSSEILQAAWPERVSFRLWYTAPLSD
jgi:hypothetical protein